MFNYFRIYLFNIIIYLFHYFNQMYYLNNIIYIYLFIYMFLLLNNYLVIIYLKLYYVFLHLFYTVFTRLYHGPCATPLWPLNKISLYISYIIYYLYRSLLVFDWLWCGVIILVLSVISYYQTDREKARRSPCLMLLYVWFLSVPTCCFIMKPNLRSAAAQSRESLLKAGFIVPLSVQVP